MGKLRIKNLLSISLCLLLFVSCASHKSAVTLPTQKLFDTTNVSRYRVLIKNGQAEISGIMLIKYIDNEWRGSIVNEFGVKAFDFIAPPGKCKLQSVMPFLDKWYIRKTVEGDFAFLLWDVPAGKTAKGKTITFSSYNQDAPFQKGFVLKNEKRKIEYSFNYIEE